MPEQKMRVFVETFGCQMNILDSELVAGQLKNAGHSFVSNAEDANVVVLNTCSVRDGAEHKVLSRLGKIKERKLRGEHLVVAVLGCMAERAHDELATKRPFIDVMVGPSKIHDTQALLESAFNNKKTSTQKSLSYFVNRNKSTDTALATSFLDDLEALDRGRMLDNRAAPWQAYVRITRGCNKFCSFCVVPRTRGPEVHRPPHSIIDEIKRLVHSGALEVTLLGQTINHYFYEDSKKHSFADLLFAIHEQVPDLKRLRFLTSYPRDFSDDALDVMKSCERICKYLHIPAQSGSDKVLAEMNRGYDLATYMSLIDRAKSRMPDISLIGDMIVGFPNESDEDFEKSLALLRAVKFKNLFIFKYSVRPNTVAHKRFTDNISLNLKKSRHQIMLDLQNEIALELHNSMINKSYTILCEAEAKLNPSSDLIQLSQKSRLIGRTEGDHIVHFDGPKTLIGKLVDVKIQSAQKLWLGASLL
jgi:tRNA-2-methylthio-N6-dimethylallyladenosine synthase